MRHVAVATVALLIGLAVGWLLPRPSAPVLDDAPAGETGTEPAPAANAHRGGVTETVARVAPDPEVLEPSPPAKAPPAAIPRGEGELAGTALFTDGAPAAGLALIASPAQLSWSIHDTDARRAVREAVQQRAVVDADGGFVFRGLWQVDYSVRPESPLHEVSHGSGSSYDFMRNSAALFRPGTTIHLTVHRLGRLRLSVLMPDGSPCPAARVMARGVTVTSALWTPAEPGLIARPGLLTITATALLDEMLRGTVQAEVSPDSEAVATVHLERAPGLHVAIRTPQPWYADVQFLLHPARDFENRAALRGERPKSISAARSGARTRSYESLAPGEYVLAAWNSGGDRVIAGVPISYAGETEEKQAVFDALPPAAHAMLMVVDAAGKTRLDARITAWVRAEGKPSRALDCRLEHADGTNWFLLPEEAREGEWTMFGAALAPGVGRVERELPLLPGQVQELRLATGATVVANVVNLRPGAAQYLEAVLYFEGSKRPLRVGGATMQNPSTGYTSHEPRILPRTVFETVPLGRCEIVINYVAGPGGYEAIEMSRQSATVAAGTNQVEVRAPDLSNLTLTLPPDTPPGSIYLRSRAGVLEGTRSETLVQWPFLPEGECSVRLETQGEMKVLVRGETRTAWAPLPYNAILVRSATAADLGLQRNDLVIRIDGEVHEGSTALRGALNAARKAEKSRLEVLRAGETVAVEVEGAKLDAAVRRGLNYQFVRN